MFLFSFFNLFIFINTVAFTKLMVICKHCGGFFFVFFPFKTTSAAEEWAEVLDHTS